MKTTEKEKSASCNPRDAGLRCSFAEQSYRSDSLITIANTTTGGGTPVRSERVNLLQKAGVSPITGETTGQHYCHAEQREASG